MGTDPTIANKIKGSKGPSPSFTAHPTVLYLPGALVDALSIAASSWTAMSATEMEFVVCANTSTKILLRAKVT